MEDGNDHLEKNLPDYISSSECSTSTSSMSSHGLSGSNSDAGVQMSGWMSKQKNTMKTWVRRYFVLSGTTLTYYETEKSTKGPRGFLHLQDVEPLTSESNGLILYLTNGKEVKVIADTQVAYKAWYTLLGAAVKKKQSQSSASKKGFVHFLQEPEQTWARYYVVIENDRANFYATEAPEAELVFSGLVRSVQKWDGKRYGLMVGLNLGRSVKLCFDSTEEQMSWLLTLEFATSFAKHSLRKHPSTRKQSASDKDLPPKPQRTSSKEITSSLNSLELHEDNQSEKNGSSMKKPEAAVTDDEEDEDDKSEDGVWI